MRRSNPILMGALTVGVALLLGCERQVSSPERESPYGPQFARGGGKGGPRGGGNDFPAELSFRDVDADADGICDDGNGDGSIDALCGDGLGSYDEPDIRADGVLVWNLAPRIFGVDLGGQVAGSAGCAGPPNGCRLPGSPATSHTGTLRVLTLGATDNSQELDGSLLAMAEGIAYPAKLWTNVLADGADEGVTFLVSFQFPTNTDDQSEPINPQIGAETSFLTVTRMGNTWTVVSAAPDYVGLVFSRSGKGRRVDIRDEGLFRVPFEMTITCASCPPPAG